MNTLSITSNYNNNMIPCVIFGEFGWSFCFVDTTNNTFIKSEDVTKSWLNTNCISTAEFINTCWPEYCRMKDAGIDCGLISYFSKDDETIYNYAKTIDVAASYNTIFNA